MRNRRHYHEPGQHYRSQSHRQRHGHSSNGTVIGLGLIAAAAGGGWTLATPDQQGAAISAARQFAVAAGAIRERAPQLGDHWSGCNDARAAGTAPIYRGEPGYRDAMDGDNDGIACEPYR